MPHGTPPTPTLYITLTTSANHHSLQNGFLNKSNNIGAAVGNFTSSNTFAKDSLASSFAEHLKLKSAKQQNRPTFMHHQLNVSFSPSHSPPIVRRSVKMNGFRNGHNKTMNLGDLKCNFRMSGTLFPPPIESIDNGGGANNLAPGHLGAAKPFHSSPNLFNYQNLMNSASPNGGAAKRPGKRVVFADDRGFQLVTIRIMSEPSDVPPVLNLAHLLGSHGATFHQSVRFFGDEESGATPLDADPDDDGYGSNGSGAGDDSPALPHYEWSMLFKQPASDYMTFRQKVDRENVALENVMLKQDQRRMTGTVKVKNMSFEKSVSLRVTFDDWLTQEEHACRYKQHRASHSNSVRTADLFDTFEFDVELEPERKMNLVASGVANSQPAAAATAETERERLQFCVCFKCPFGEFWDNNGGQNYLLVNERLAKAKLLSAKSSVHLNSSSSCAASTDAKNSINNSIDKKSLDQLEEDCEKKELALENADQERRSAPNKKFAIFQARGCGDLPSSDAFTMDMSNWTQFASWNHLTSDRPYW